MNLIVRKQPLNDSVCLMEIEAPYVAQKAKAGQFIILRATKDSERIPLTVNDSDPQKGTVCVVYQTLGEGTMQLHTLAEGDYIHDFVGPLGNATHTEGLKKVAIVAGGVGCAIAYPVAKALHKQGCCVHIIAGFRSKDLVIFKEEMKLVSDRYILMTDDGSDGQKGLVTEALEKLIVEGEGYDEVFAIGPLMMMKFVCLLTKKYNVKTIVSMNPIMIDGTGMCGSCRLAVGGQTKFACVDGPEFDGHEVDFDEVISRNRRFGEYEHKRREESCNLMHKTPINMQPFRTAMPVQSAEERSHSFEEMTLGYTPELAMNEAARCLECKNHPCCDGCPVHVDIPGFIEAIKRGEFEEAYQIVTKSNNLPAVCGRVCPQEKQCESKCTRGYKGDSVGIGYLERFVADWHNEHTEPAPIEIEKNGKKVAVVGSGPSSLSCAGDLAKLGYDVTIFEALHVPGGVLVYGIPEFRLPKHIVAREIANLQAMGVKIETNVVIGKTLAIEDLYDMGFGCTFVGTGAGLPRFMGIPGENACGVYSANEFLTRINLMKAYQEGSTTPIPRPRKAVVVGGGNVAMDAARSALRIGADVTIVYRRSEAELPARLEEVAHAKEEGIHFCLQSNPTAILTDDKGNVIGVQCAEMMLGEPDASGRRRPIENPDKQFVIEADTVIMSIGTSANPLLKNSTEGLDVSNKGGIVIDPETGMTSIAGVFAGGDAVTGAATVILAMGAGKLAAKGIDEYLRNH